MTLIISVKQKHFTIQFLRFEDYVTKCLNHVLKLLQLSSAPSSFTVNTLLFHVLLKLTYFDFE